MINNAFCCCIFSVMRDHGPISLPEISIHITRHRTAKFAPAQGISVPIFNGSPPLA